MILFRIALRNILATRMRTLIIGVLTVLGTALVVVGLSLLSSLEQSMASSVVGSVTGHIQVYSDEAGDKLDLFGPPTGSPDLRTIEEFPKVRKALESHPNVHAVIPMANDFAVVFAGNFLDAKLAELRQAQAAGEQRRIGLLKEQIRHVVETMETETDALEAFKSDSTQQQELASRRELLAQASQTTFWDGFEEAMERSMEFLENKIAPLALDESMIFLRYLGTDLDAFSKNFSRFRIVDGTMVPPGKRGFLFAKQVYERQVKHPIARRLDFIKEGLDAGISLESDMMLGNFVKQNVRQYREILFQLDGDASKLVAEVLAQHLGQPDGELSDLLQSFLKVDDSNFSERYKIFYDVIAPQIVLHKVKIGDTLTIRAVTKSGYMTSVAVPVYGTYELMGLEKSVLAGAFNLLDMMTFRDLYGGTGPEQREELAALVEKAGIVEVTRDEAEDALFGGDPQEGEPEEGEPEEGASAEGAGFDEFAHVDMSSGGQRYTQELLETEYSREELDRGIVVHAAVVLRDASKLEETLAELRSLSESEGLGVQAVGWRDASGLVGQFLGVLWAVLVASVLIIFLVALVIINNTMVMATMERTREIGTLRAMGASRGYVLKMFLVESSTLGLGFGLLGMMLGAGLMLWAGSSGIPAFNSELYFLFGGPRLYPTLLPEQMLIALGVVVTATVASTLYPARLASQIAPVRAMERED